MDSELSTDQLTATNSKVARIKQIRDPKPEEIQETPIQKEIFKKIFKLGRGKPKKGYNPFEFDDSDDETDSLENEDLENYGASGKKNTWRTRVQPSRKKEVEKETYKEDELEIILSLIPGTE